MLVMMRALVQPVQPSNSPNRSASSTFQLRLPTNRVALSSTASSVLDFFAGASASSSALRFLEGTSVFSSAESESESSLSSLSSESSESDCDLKC